MTQLGLHPIIQSFTIYEYIEYGAGRVPGSHLIVQLLCSDGGMADELIGLLAVTDERRKQHSIVLLEGCTRCTSTATSFIITAYPYGWPIF